MDGTKFDLRGGTPIWANQTSNNLVSVRVLISMRGPCHSLKNKCVLTTLRLKRVNMHKFFVDGKVQLKKGKPVKIRQWNKNKEEKYDIRNKAHIYRTERGAN